MLEGPGEVKLENEVVTGAGAKEDGLGSEPLDEPNPVPADFPSAGEANDENDEKTEPAGLLPGFTPKRLPAPGAG